MPGALRPFVLIAVLALCWTAPAGAQPSGTVTGCCSAKRMRATTPS